MHSCGQKRRGLDGDRAAKSDARGLAGYPLIWLMVPLPYFGPRPPLFGETIRDHCPEVPGTSPAKSRMPPLQIRSLADCRSKTDAATRGPTDQRKIHQGCLRLTILVPALASAAQRTNDREKSSASAFSPNFNSPQIAFQECDRSTLIADRTGSPRL